MKKILTVSLFAMMAVSAANADIASTDYVDKAKSAAISAAASDATSKANAAQSAAEAKVTALNGSLAAVAKSGAYADLSGKPVVDSTFSATSTNAATSKAIASYVSTELGALHTEQAGINNTIGELESDIEKINNSDAMKSGITLTKVSTYDGYATTIAANTAAAEAAQSTADAKQAKSTAAYQMGGANGTWTTMSQAQQDALNSGVTSTTVTQVNTNKTDIATNTTNIAKKQDASTIGTVSAETMGTKATTVVGAIKEVVDTKQAKSTAAYQMGGANGTWTTMSQAQQDALNSGVTAAKVSTYDGYATTIAANTAAAEVAQSTADAKQAKSTADYQMGNKDGSWTAMSQAQQDALNSGVTSTTVTQVNTNKTNIATKQAKSTADYQMGNKDGSWTAMSDTQKNALNSGVTTAVVEKANSAMQEANLKALQSWTTAKCNETNVTCSLVSKSGTIAWEKVTY